jgi:hypothetical protein
VVVEAGDMITTMSISQDLGQKTDLDMATRTPMFHQ